MGLGGGGVVIAAVVFLVCAGAIGVAVALPMMWVRPGVQPPPVIPGLYLVVETYLADTKAYSRLIEDDKFLEARFGPGVLLQNMNTVGLNSSWIRLRVCGLPDNRTLYSVKSGFRNVADPNKTLCPTP